MKYSFLLVVIVGLAGAHIYCNKALHKTQINTQYTQNLSREYANKLKQLEEFEKIKDYPKLLALYQQYASTAEASKLSTIVKNLAEKNHIQVVEFRKKDKIYELSFLAVLDTDVYAFWHSCKHQMSGLVTPIVFGLYRPLDSQEKLQGRIHFSLILDKEPS